MDVIGQGYQIVGNFHRESIAAFKSQAQSVTLI